MLRVCRRSDLCASGMIRKKFYETSSHCNLLIHDTNVVSFRVKKKMSARKEKNRGKCARTLWKSSL